MDEKINADAWLDRVGLACTNVRTQHDRWASRDCITPRHGRSPSINCRWRLHGLGYPFTPFNRSQQNSQPVMPDVSTFVALGALGVYIVVCTVCLNGLRVA